MARYILEFLENLDPADITKEKRILGSLLREVMEKHGSEVVEAIRRWIVQFEVTAIVIKWGNRENRGFEGGVWYVRDEI